MGPTEGILGMEAAKMLYPRWDPAPSSLSSPVQPVCWAKQGAVRQESVAGSQQVSLRNGHCDAQSTSTPTGKFWERWEKGPSTQPGSTKRPRTPTHWLPWGTRGGGSYLGSPLQTQWSPFRVQVAALVRYGGTREGKKTTWGPAQAAPG